MYENGTDDQLPRFLREGIWENGYEDRYLDEVRSMRPGERIAVKSAYTRKHNLPFDNRGKTVSVMAIKATGIIRENLQDGRHVRVDWQLQASPREWYFYTNRRTVWCPRADDWMNQNLVAFAFDGANQDIDRFLSVPYWRERYVADSTSAQFEWTAFFEAVAERLLQFKSDRTALIKAAHRIVEKNGLPLFQDHFANGERGPLTDICPFTTMGLFNRGMKDVNRSRIARDLAEFLGIDIPAPTSFPGVPVLNNQSSWFFSYARTRAEGDIDALWRVFAAAHAIVSDDAPSVREEFHDAYNRALQVRMVKWNLSTGLYWSNPWDFPTLDSNSRSYLTGRMHLTLPTTRRDEAIDAESYLDLIETLRARFLKSEELIHSFPELSLAAWQPEDRLADADSTAQVDSSARRSVAEKSPEPYRASNTSQPYLVEDVIAEGCFLSREEIENALRRLRSKKNLILQGPPGTGKTWLAKRLAFALIGQRAESRVRAVQFHPNLSYEDFVRGWRPTGEGKLALADGVFMEAISAASDDPDTPYVVVIEEINRGNPAQIFGELLTLLEAGKRSPEDALELCYPDADGVRRPVHIPANLFVIGTMNLADRSLALVDLALRRRFAFLDLEPRVSDSWQEFVVQRRNVEAVLAGEIRLRMQKLNARIADDPRLGKHYQVGHSYVTPAEPLASGGTREWFRQLAQTEIVPLLEEYWFDAPSSASSASTELLSGW